MVEFSVFRAFLYLNHYYNTEIKVLFALAEVKQSYKAIFLLSKSIPQLKVTQNTDPCLDEHIPQKQFQ